VNGLGEFYFTIEANPASGVIDMYAGPNERAMAPHRRANELRPVAQQVLTDLDVRVAEALPARVRSSLRAALRQITELDRDPPACLPIIAGAATAHRSCHRSLGID